MRSPYVSRITISAGFTKATPAKALGVVDRTWAIGELIDAALDADLSSVLLA